MVKSTSTKGTHKVRLSIHKATGYWCKVHRGKRHYFEKVADDPKGTRSLDQWLLVKAGRAPAKRGAIRLRDICNKWLAHKTDRLNAGEIVQDTWDEYKHTCSLVTGSIDKYLTPDEIQPSDFAKLRRDMAKRYGPVALAKHIGQVRSLFKFAFDAGLIDKPMKFGPGFAKPSAKVLRKQRNAKGKQYFEPAEIHQLLTTKHECWRAMILLGVQAGFGNRDVAELQLSDVNLETGWIEYPRAKTGTLRRIPLWRETVLAIKNALRTHPGTSPRLFIDWQGRDFIESSHGNNRVAGAFKSVLVATGFPEFGRGFYCLRRTFQTQAEESGDIVAVRAIMGHTDAENDMSARYRQRVSDERLRRAVDAVHAWLFGGAK